MVAVKAHRRRRVKNVNKKGVNSQKRLSYAFVSIAIIAIVLFVALIVELSYSNMLNSMIKNANVANPPIRFLVGISPNSSINRLTPAAANQTFCPENATIVNQSDSSFSYDYYTLLQPGTEFTYVFASNSSNEYTFATVIKPFSIASYSKVAFNQSVCAGYPNAKYGLKLIIKAPEHYIGPIYFNLYR